MTDKQVDKQGSLSRRQLITGGAIAATAGVALSAVPAKAANGDAVTVGGAFEGTGTTTLVTTATGAAPAIRGTSNASQAGRGVGGEAHSLDGYGVHGLAFGNQGTGVVGESISAATSGIGVLGHALSLTGTTRGVYGVTESSSGHGVAGYAAHALGGIGVRGAGSTGVYGLGFRAEANGVHGETEGTGVGAGVYGKAVLDTGASRGVWGTARSSTGVGILAEHTAGGQALRVEGQASFSSSGLATIAKGQKSITVSPGFDIGPTSKVFVTLQSRGGTLKMVLKDETANTFTIWTTANATQAISAVWFVIN